MATLSSLVEKLYSDDSFRRDFANNPAKALEQAGFNASLFALPNNLDYDTLSARLEQIYQAPGAKEAASRLDADQLWQRFGIIGLSKEAVDLVKGDPLADGDPSLVAVVVYGSSMVTSTSQTTTTVATVGVGAGLRSIDQLQVLRSLADHPKEQLSFSIVGPNGVAVSGVSADMIKAFVGRLR